MNTRHGIGLIGRCAVRNINSTRRSPQSLCEQRSTTKSASAISYKDARGASGRRVEQTPPASSFLVERYARRDGAAAATARHAGGGQSAQQFVVVVAFIRAIGAFDIVFAFLLVARAQ